VTNVIKQLTLNFKIMYQAVEILVPLGAFAMVFGVVYVAVTANHREKMAMIEAGMNPYESKNKKHSKIRNGLLLFLVPLGIFIGNIITPLFENMNNSEMGLLFGFLFGGMALIAAYFLEKKFPDTDNL
jgi:hypothetical protein